MSSSSIQTLSDSAPFHSLPAEYFSRSSDEEQQQERTKRELDETIPTIDLSLLTSEHPDDRYQELRRLASALEDWGFITVVNHGVSEEAMAEVMEMSRGFFENLTVEEKSGYAGKGVSDPIRYGTSFNPTVEDVRYWRDYLKLILHPNFHCPSKPHGFREVVAEYSSSIREVVRVLLRRISESIGLDQCYMEKTLELDSGTQLFTANYYPPCPQPELALGLPPHSDHGYLTILIQNGVGGLQVKHKGKWVDVNAPPNSLLINLGDHMEIISNGVYKSVVHRALLNTNVTRMSVLVLHGPSGETSVEPTPEFVKRSDHPAAYRGVKYREFVEYQQSNRLKEKSVLEGLKLQDDYL